MKAGGLGGWRLRGWSLENSRANSLKGRNVFQVLLPVVFFPGVLKIGRPRDNAHGGSMTHLLNLFRCPGI